MDFLIFLAIIGFGLLLLYWAKIGQQAEDEVLSKKYKALYERINSKYSIQKHYIYKGEQGIAFDSQTDKIILFNTVSDKVFKKQEILQVEIVEDGNTISQISRTGQLGGALLGTMIAGTAGAIVGGLSASRSKVEKITDMKLRVIVDDTSSPIHEVTFFHTSKNEAIKKSDATYKQVYRTILEWQKIVEILIKRADQEEQKLNIN
ncbi:hypothetical protein BEH_07190 [Priestia filamentosa]|uniref:Uncharacterized protein n=1 Tax=Priestia filamentosa TaxID=1402861 RepID=A0A0H4KHY6_9BACI|nr:hypothetical protein [Priestia filamentosa]AKO91904.1 hypothetical protein BEH_07190 [Priestia filamentosa]